MERRELSPANLETIYLSLCEHSSLEVYGSPTWQSKNPVPFLNGWPVCITSPLHSPTKPQPLPLWVLGTGFLSQGAYITNAPCLKPNFLSQGLNSQHLFVMRGKVQREKQMSKLKSPSLTKAKPRKTSPMAEEQLSQDAKVLCSLPLGCKLCQTQGLDGLPHPFYGLINVSSAEPASPLLNSFTLLATKAP